ncbi:MAG: Cof-type HAD-IIB family hydrolase [Terriglobales bacterium]|jgi:Cof subfamily protein (haloacid dehalogenase superfamily)
MSICLVVSDVDGTLVTPDRSLTPRAREAVAKIKAAGIAFTISSSRPPAGLRMLIDELHLEQPVAPFNGGLLVRPDLSIIQERLVPPLMAAQCLRVLASRQLSIWLYSARAWYVLDRHGPRVDHEEETSNFAPTVVANFDGVLGEVTKIVGVSEDYPAVESAERDLQLALGDQIAATRSQPRYLDITSPDANKGMVVQTLSQMLGIAEENIATIGDGANDILMFRHSGLSIAMGNASDEVKQAARFVTSSNCEDGFAEAMEKFVLGKAS